MFTPDMVQNGCYVYHKADMVPQQQQQQPMSHMGSGNNNNHYSTDEENVGSLLRLVYSCPDQMLDHDSAVSFVESNNPYFNQQLQTQGGHCGQKTAILSNEPLMEYPMLEGIPLEFL
jgi:hypothetical protein